MWGTDYIAILFFLDQKVRKIFNIEKNQKKID